MLLLIILSFFWVDRDFLLHARRIPSIEAILFRGVVESHRNGTPQDHAP